MTKHPLFGVMLAAIGTLTLTPDSMFMRLSGMTGLQMTAWRGLLMGGVLIVAWLIFSRTRRADLKYLPTRAGLIIVMCQFFNSLLFCLGIALAPVAVVLFGLAAVPVFAALFAWALIGEPTGRATWIAIALVMLGIGIAVSGGHGEDGAQLDVSSLIGAALGLGVAMALALNFVVIRAQPDLPILPLIGCGALLSGVISLAIIGPAEMAQGTIWAMAATGAIVLPLSFFLLSLASRYTHASNVSLLMLMETVLGPLWVWLVIGEALTGRMLLGGAIVIFSLAVYLIVTGQQARSRARSRS